MVSSIFGENKRLTVCSVASLVIVLGSVASMRRHDQAQSKTPESDVRVTRVAQLVEQPWSVPAVQANLASMNALADRTSPLPAEVLPAPLRVATAGARTKSVSAGLPAVHDRAAAARRVLPAVNELREHAHREDVGEPPTDQKEPRADRMGKRYGLHALLPTSSFRVARIAESTTVMLELDRGVQRPIALLESGKKLTGEQAKAKDQIAEEFETKISEAARAPSGNAAPVDQVWLEEQARANERYRLFFGDDAYNVEIVRAAQEALARP